MRAIRTFAIVATLVGSLAAAPAALAAGRAPMGHGVFSLTDQDDISITNLVCSDPTSTEVHTARGGLAAWVKGDPDRFYVLSAVSGEVTVTTPEGSEQFTFFQGYGNKTGRSTTVTCSMDFAIAYGDVTQHGRMDATMVQIW
jgi:hypothetical protein